MIDYITYICYPQFFFNIGYIVVTITLGYYSNFTLSGNNKTFRSNNFVTAPSRFDYVLFTMILMLSGTEFSSK